MEVLETSSAVYAENLAEVCRRHAADRASNIAYRWLRDGEVEERLLTFSTLDREARAIAAQLQAWRLSGGRVPVGWAGARVSRASFHLGDQFDHASLHGWRPFETSENSRNNAWLAMPSAARRGTTTITRSRRPRYSGSSVASARSGLAPDPLLEAVGLAWDVNVAPRSGG
jgi:hypothetical protein